MAETGEKKRYILFSKEDGRPDSEKPCAFFASAAGCRNGAKCKFMHGAAPAAPAPAPAKKHEKVAAPAPAPVEEVKRVKKERARKEGGDRETHVQPEPVRVPVPTPVQPKAAPVQHKPVAVAAPPAVSEAEKTIKALQKQLEDQQKALDAQMKMLQQQQQIQMMQQQVQAAAPMAQVRVEPKKENKRKQAEATPVAMPNKSPKTVAPAQPVATNNGFGSLVQSITQRAVPVSVPVVPVSARVNNTYVNNTAHADSDNSGDEDSDFLFGAVNHVLNTGLVNSNNTTPYKQAEAPARVPLNPNSPFVNTTEVTKALQTSGSKHALQGSAKKNIFAAKSPAAPANTSVTAPIAPRAPAAVFDPASADFSTLPWARLVTATHANARFPINYSFPEDSAWVKAKPYGAWCAKSNHPTVLSMDCEMCECTDPVTGEKVDNALVRFSVVDCTDNGRVLIDSLVSPGLPITDARTHIHGITEAQMATAPWTLRHAQAALLGLCSDRTVFVGHSLHKDLRALKFNHSNVVDTAYLFALENEPGAAPSLRDVSEQILGTKLSDTHDSVEDARASLYAAAVLLISGPQPLLVRKVGNPSSAANGGSAKANAAAEGAFSLLVHRIPDYCTEQHVQEMIVAYTQVMPAKILPITRGAPSTGADSVPSGKTTIYFSSQIHCDLAFESIPGPNRPDKQQRDQKRVYFKGGGYICVRK